MVEANPAPGRHPVRDTTRQAVCWCPAEWGARAGIPGLVSEGTDTDGHGDRDRGTVYLP